MSGIPVSAFSENARMRLVFLEREGHITPESISRYTLPRAEHRLKGLRNQLQINQWNFAARQQIERKIEALEDAISEVFGYTSPSYIGGTRAADGYESGVTNDMGLTKCRWPSCSNLVNREDRWMGGACAECRAAAHHEHGKDEHHHG